MASFSFASGNVGKLLRIPLYLAGRIATLAIPRGPRWVFASAAGVADGPLELATLAAADGHAVTWLVRNSIEAEAARARGFQPISRDSFAGFWATARARVVCVSHGLGDANRYGSAGAFLVQLWHGIPLKRIGLDSPETLRSGFLPNSRIVRAVLKRMFLTGSARIALMPAASHLVRGRLESAFALPDYRITVTGEPRVDVLSRGSLADRRAESRALLASRIGDLQGATVLYAPTWRDGDADPGVPSPAEWALIQDALDALDATLIIRAHPMSGTAYTPPAATSRIRMLGSDVLPDVTPALATFDVLVTDYSSLAYDAALVQVPVLYFAPDVAAYAARRGFYGTFEDVAGTDYARAWTELLSQLADTVPGGSSRAERCERGEALSQRVHQFRDGNNARRVYQQIQQRLQPRQSGGQR